MRDNRKIRKAWAKNRWEAWEWYWVHHVRRWRARNLFDIPPEERE